MKPSLKRKFAILVQFLLIFATLTLFVQWYASRNTAPAPSRTSASP